MEREFMFKGRTVLVTGGTGSFGRAFVKRICSDYQPRKVIVFSRDEFKQHQMEQEVRFENIRFQLGDVRDLDRLRRSFSNVDYIVHAAALKQVPKLEYCPTEAVKTNVMGACNVVEAALDSGVAKVVGLSSDKAVNPVNVYGATKLCMEKIFTAANSYNRTKFCCVRYGNVIGSRGSVVPVFREQIARDGSVTITDLRMTRFWITLDAAVDLVLFALGTSMGGEVYVPRIPSMKTKDLAVSMGATNLIETGIRPGEKLHETLISEGDTNVRFVDGDRIIPTELFTSDTNDWWLDGKEILDGNK